MRSIAYSVAITLIAVTVAAQDDPQPLPVAHAGSKVRWEQETTPPFTHFYVCWDIDSDTTCTRVERSAGFVDGQTETGDESFSLAVPPLAAGRHTLMLWTHGEPPAAYAAFYFMYDPTAVPPDQPPTIPLGAAHSVRIW